MNTTFDRIKELIRNKDIRISEHGYDELSQDDITLKDVFDTFEDAVLIESYPEYPKGSCVLLLQKDRLGNPIHVVWGIPSGVTSPAVLVTAYRPDSSKWSNDFTRRK